MRCDAPTLCRAPRRYRSLPSGCGGRGGRGDGMAGPNELRWINVQPKVRAENVDGGNKPGFPNAN
jgi:hypothetical protein